MFLALISNKKFWVKNQKIILAGEWCLPNLNKSRSKYHKKISFIWQDSNNEKKAYKYCNKLYFKSLSDISKSLNQYLKINQDVQFYHILLGNWTIHFIHQAYDKFQIFNQAKKKGATNTYILDNSQYYYPIDFEDYSQQLLTEIYQLQLFSQIALHINFKHKIKKNTYQKFSFKNTFKTKIINSFSYWVELIFQMLNYYICLFFSKKRVVYVNPHFKRRSFYNKLKLFIASKASVHFDNFNYKKKIISKEKIDLNFRKV